jgi:hypothetical protein
MGLLKHPVWMSGHAMLLLHFRVFHLQTAPGMPKFVFLHHISHLPNCQFAMSMFTLYGLLQVLCSIGTIFLETVALLITRHPEGGPGCEKDPRPCVMHLMLDKVPFSLLG